MKDSLFSRIYSYRQRENNSPLENFLTEIFSYCLETDLKFRKDFFSIFLNITSHLTDFTIITQQEYKGLGRPDIEISAKNISILFECKVEANERLNQLEDYTNILHEFKPECNSKHIIYLTKYFEHKETSISNIKLHLIRWFNIYELISDENSQVTIQLKHFLNENSMEKIKNFTIQDLLAMKTIPETMTKMDELLEFFKPEFQKRFGGYSKESSRSTRLPNNCYINYVTLKYQNFEYGLLIGFDWDYDDEIPYLGLTIEIPKKKFEKSDIMSILRKELVKKNKWEEVDYDSIINFSVLKPITDFISQLDDNIPSMKKFIYNNLEILDTLKRNYPKLLNK